jgi:hypothetical protein
MKITRRTLLGSVATAAAVAQTSPPAPVNYLTVSADTNKRNADAIAKVALPQSTEPAFSFKA